MLVSNFLQHLWTDLWNCTFSFWAFQWDLVLLSAFHEKHFYCSNREQSSFIDVCQILFNFCHQESHWHQHWLLVIMSYNAFLHHWHGISQPLVLVTEKCFQGSLIFAINASELPKLLSNIVLYLVIFTFWIMGGAYPSEYF